MMDKDRNTWGIEGQGKDFGVVERQWKNMEGF